MRRFRLLILMLGGLLVFAGATQADVVTQPLRKFGLGDLQQVAMAPNGRWMATSGSAGAFVWDFENGTVLHRLEAHRSLVPALSFSPDSEVLLTGGYDGVVRAWNVESGLEIRSYVGHTGGIWDLAFAPDGQSFVSCGDNTARVWSLGTGELLHTLAVSKSSVIRALFAPDGERIATVDLGATTNGVRLWNVAEEQVIRSFEHRALALGFTTNSQLVTAGEDLAVHVWDIETGQIVRSLEGATQYIVGLVASTNDSLVTVGSQNGAVITWDATTGTVQQNFFGEKMVAMAAIPGTNQIVTAGVEKLVRVKTRLDGTNLRVFAGHTTSTTLGVAFSPDGFYVVSGGTESFTRLWNRTNAQQVGFFPGHGAGTEATRFSPDGTRLLTTFGAPVYSAQLWNTNGLLEREFFGHTGWLLAAVFSPNGERIATGAQDGTARLWDVATGGLVRTFASPGAWIRSVAVSSNGLFLASGGSDGVARLWDTTNGQLLRSFSMNAGTVRGLEFSPATGDLLVAWEDGFLRTFDPVTGATKLDSIAPAAFLNDAVFSPDGRFILGGEGWPFFTARLWDARNGAELRVFDGHAGPVDSVAFNATGTSILTGSDIVRLWSIADLAARLQSERKPNGLELIWHVGMLQQATNVAGPWLDITNAVSPWLAPSDQDSGFFRVKTTSAE